MRKQDLMVQLKARRLRARMTQVQLARRLGTSQPTIARIENGEAAPALDLIERWAAATGFPLVLTLGEAPPVSVPPEERRRRILQAFGPKAFDPWQRQPGAVEQRTLRRLGIEPGADIR